MVTETGKKHTIVTKNKDLEFLVRLGMIYWFQKFSSDLSGDEEK